MLAWLPLQTLFHWLCVCSCVCVVAVFPCQIVAACLCICRTVCIFIIFFFTCVCYSPVGYGSLLLTICGVFLQEVAEKSGREDRNRESQRHTCMHRLTEEPQRIVGSHVASWLLRVCFGFVVLFCSPKIILLQVFKFA